jgi:spore maturation protein A
MMGWIWFCLMFISVVCGVVTGKINAVSQAAISGAGEAVMLFLLLLGVICFWNGLMNIARHSGITNALAKLISPVTKRLFPDLPPGGPAMEAISMNIVANFLGLGNAATPFGLKAMMEMAKSAAIKKVATNSMVMLIVINTASIQLIPTTIAALRVKYASAAPFDILPCIWLASAVTVVCGVILAKSMSKFSKLG